MTPGTRATRSRVKSRTRSAHSGAKRPPVSHARTRNAHRGLAATSAYMRRLSARAVGNVAPPRVAAAPTGSPKEVTGERRVTSHTSGSPAAERRPCATKSTRRESDADAPGNPRSRTGVWGAHRAPASLRTCTHARSIMVARRWTRPVRLHVVQWSPSASIATEHERPGQLSTADTAPCVWKPSGSSIRSLRSKHARNATGGKVSAGDVGSASSHADA